MTYEHLGTSALVRKQFLGGQSPLASPQNCGEVEVPGVHSPGPGSPQIYLRASTRGLATEGGELFVCASQHRFRRQEGGSRALEIDSELVEIKVIAGGQGSNKGRKLLHDRRLCVHHASWIRRRPPRMTARLTISSACLPGTSKPVGTPSSSIDNAMVDA